MRTLILAMPLLAAAAMAASHSESTTYVDGNLTGVSPNSGATLTVSDDKQLTLRTGLSNVSVPFEKISHAELGAVKETSHGAPLYKFWARHHAKTGTQLLIVNFKNDEGQDRTMTLELEQAAAASVYENIEAHSGKPAEAAAAPAPVGAPAAATAPAAESKAEADAPAAPAPKASKKQKSEAKADPKPDLMKSGKESGDWWGDSWWKTSRNSDKWNKSNGTNAPDQQ